MANRPRFSLSDPAHGQTHAAPVILTERTVSLHVDARKSLSWIDEKRARKKVLWRLMTDGTALGLDAATHLPPLLERTKNDPALETAVRRAFFQGGFIPEDRLVLPEPVIAHVFERHIATTEDHVWLQTADDQIILTPQHIFSRLLSDANALIDESLDIP